jgi:hypothetical protein
MLMLSKEVRATARGEITLATWAYFLTHLKVRFHLNHCGTGETKTKGVPQKWVSTKGAQTGKKIVARIYA